MNDIEQFRNLMKGRTQSINTDQIIPKKTTPNNNHWTGIVINNNDPDQLGRCQIKIYGYYEELAPKNIPWAIPDIPSMASTKGNFVIPELNTIVRGYFDNGDESKPVYTSVAFNASYTDEELNPFDNLIRTEDYPQTMVLFQTDQSDYLVMNKKTGEIAFTHHTGAVTRINPDGSIDISTCTYSAGNAPMNINVSGDINITTMGQCNISAMSGVNINTTTGKISLGNNPIKAPVCNLRNCLICGAPHQIGNTQVEA
jgi:hypothetical protein